MVDECRETCRRGVEGEFGGVRCRDAGRAEEDFVVEGAGVVEGL